MTIRRRHAFDRLWYLFGMARDHSELDCWKLCDELEERVHEITARATFTDENLREQLDEAVDSPCANIGEGFSRYYPKDNARFVRVAKGSLAEVMEHMRKVRRKGYATAEECGEILSLAGRARGAVTGYVRYLESAPAPNPPSAPRRRQSTDLPRRRDTQRRTAPRRLPKRQNRGTPAPNPNAGTGSPHPERRNQNPGTTRTPEPREPGTITSRTAIHPFVV